VRQSAAMIKPGDRRKVIEMAAVTFKNFKLKSVMI